MKLNFGENRVRSQPDPFIFEDGGRFYLYVTAGSDYHGANKLIPLGDTGLEDASEGPEGLQRFLREVHRAK